MDIHEHICKAFATEPTVAGGARIPVMGNFFLGVISIFATETLYMIPLFILGHIGIIFLTKKEPKFFTIFLSHLKFKNYYY